MKLVWLVALTENETSREASPFAARGIKRLVLEDAADAAGDVEEHEGECLLLLR
jgi:hypothetical protein